jgi:putative transposase
VDHLPDEHKADIKRKLQKAYAMTDYADAKRALDRPYRELLDRIQAARSLEEGIEETLTVHKLRVRDQLRRTLSCTNVIESAFSIVETVCRNVKGWRTGDQIERRVGSPGYWLLSASSAESSGIARFRCCCPRWPMPFLRNRLRKEPLSPSL